MGSSKGFKSVLICVLVLGLVLQQARSEGFKSCCRDTTARNCYNVCRVAQYGPPEACGHTCGCKTTSEDSCPSGYPELHTHAHAGTPKAIEFCRTGCRSSVCGNMNKLYLGEETKIGVACGSACDSFCNKMAVSASVAA